MSSMRTKRKFGRPGGAAAEVFCGAANSAMIARIATTTRTRQACVRSGIVWRMMRIEQISRLLSIIVLLIAPSALFAAKPNIVLFIADDLTWHDVGPYGATDVRT